MTRLIPYLRTVVHVHIWPLDICASGILDVRDGHLRFDQAPGWAVALDRLRLHETPFGPTELPEQSDVALTHGDLLVEIWRGRIQPDGCGLVALADLAISGSLWLP